MKCFYHNDADGRCAGFWVKQSAPIRDTYPVEFIEISYGTPFPFDTILPQEQIYIVDYSISPEEMLRLLEITTDVTWIDHHKTAIEKYADFPYKIPGIRLEGVSGCMLTYCYIHYMTESGQGDVKPFEPEMMKHAPEFTQLINDWDIWKFEFGDRTRWFITAFNTLNFNPKSALWYHFYSRRHYTSDIIKMGKTMTQYRDGWSKDYCKSKGFEVLVDGIPAFAMNLGNCNSDFFKSVSDNYEILMPFSFDGENWTVSLYSKTIDVGDIAKRLGGGGHKGAAGFTMKAFPFVKVTEYNKEFNPYLWRLISK